MFSKSYIQCVIDPSVKALLEEHNINATFDFRSGIEDDSIVMTLNFMGKLKKEFTLEYEVNNTSYSKIYDQLTDFISNIRNNHPEFLI